MNKRDSDWDFIGICGGPYFYAHRLVETVIRAEESPNGEEMSLSVNMMHLSYFLETLKDAFINAIMLVFLPKKFVFLEHHDISAHYILYHPNLRISVQMDSTHNMAKAKRLWRSGDFYTAKKNVLHGIRYLSYALQLLGPEAKIYDYLAGNEYFEEVMSWQEPKESEEENKRLWTALEARFAPLYTKMTNEMREICQIQVNSAKNWERAWIARKYKISEKLANSYHLKHEISKEILIDYLNEHGVETAARNFGIVCTRHNEHKNLFSFGRTQWAAMDLSILKWCSGIVLERQDNNWKVVAAPLPKIFATTSSRDLIPTINWDQPNKISIEEHLDGKMALLYYYEGKWQISSKMSADGSEMIGWVSPIRHENWKSLVVEGFNFNPVHEANMLIQLVEGVPNPTFAEHFWMIFKSENLKIEDLDTTVCYIFEVESQWMLNVVENKTKKGKKWSLTLIAARNASDHTEIETYTQAKKIGADTIRRFNVVEAPKTSISDALVEIEGRGPSVPLSMGSSESIFASMRYLSPLDSVGFVVRLENGLRVAFRSPQFCALESLHPLSDYNQIQKLLLELSRAFCDREWLTLSKYSMWKEKFEIVDRDYQRTCTELQVLWEKIRAVTKLKDRAAAAAMLTHKPVGYAEIFHLIKYEMLDVHIRELLSTLPLKRLQLIIRNIVNPPEPAPSNRTQPHEDA